MGPNPAATSELGSGICSGYCWQAHQHDILSWRRCVGSMHCYGSILCRRYICLPITLLTDWFAQLCNTNTETKDFELCFVPDTGIDHPTEIFLGSRYNYPNGGTVQCDAGLSCSSTHVEPTNVSAKDVLLVLNSKSSASESKTQCVRIRGHSGKGSQR